MASACKLIAAILLAASAPVTKAQGSQDAVQLDRIEEALATRNYPEASELIDALVIARQPRNGELRSDPLLNGLLGRVYLTGGEPAIALAYLERATGTGPVPQRIEAMLALAEAQDLFSQRAQAAATLARLEREPLGTEQRQRLILAHGVRALLDDPRAALVRAAELEGGERSIRFEGAMLAGQAHSLLGEGAAARAAADRAWRSHPPCPSIAWRRFAQHCFAPALPPKLPTATSSWPCSTWQEPAASGSTERFEPICRPAEKAV